MISSACSMVVEPMRDDQRGAIAHQLHQRFLDAAFGLVVQRRHGLVENQDGRVLEQRARNGDALALAAREQCAAVSDRRVQPLRQIRGEFVDVGDVRRLLHGFRIRIVDAEGDVVADRIVEQHHVLAHQRHVVAQVAQIALAHVDAVDQDRCRRWRRRNAAPDRPASTCRCPERPTMAMFLPAGTLRFTECNTPPFSLLYAKLTSRNSMAPCSRPSLRPLGEVLGGLIEHFEDAGARGQALLQRAERGDQRAHRRRGQQQRGEETPEFAHGHRVVVHLHQRHPQHAAQAQRSDELHHRVAGRLGGDQLHVAAPVVFVDRLELARLLLLRIEHLDDTLAVQRLLGDARDVAHRCLDARAVTAERLRDLADDQRQRRREDHDEQRQLPVEHEQPARSAG